MQAKTKRILSAAATLVVVAAMAVGGTFAYRNREEHKANTVQGKAKYQAKLVEEFDRDPKWEVGGPDINKKVSVKNMGGEAPHFPGTGWGDIYVGVQILEYMDLTTVNYTYYGDPNPVRFMVDTKGQFVSFPAPSDTAGENPTPEQFDAIKASAGWKSADVIADSAKCGAFFDSLTANDFVRVKGLYDTQDYWYLKTKAGDPNGQYGAYVVTGIAPGATTPITGTQRVSADGQAISTYQTYLDNYAPHLWDNCAEACHEYAQLILGNDVMTLSAWNALSPAAKETTKVWILDANGWAYWSQALPPYTGTADNETAKLLEAIRPIKEAEDDIYYDVYVHMEAYSKSEIPGGWPIVPATPVPTAPGNIGPASLPGATVNVPYSQQLTATGATPITWAVTSGALPQGLALDPMTGVISGTPTGSAGTFNFEVTATNAGGPSVPQSMAIVVSAAPVAPSITSAASATATNGTASTFPVTATGTAPITYGLSGTVPAGVTINSTTGLITIANTVATGTHNFTITASNGISPNATQPFELTVSASSNLPVKTNSPTNPFTPIENVTVGNNVQTALDSDFMSVDVYYHTTPPMIILTSTGDVSHYGYLKLSDIIDDGSLEDVQIDYVELATLNGGKLNSTNLVRKQDPRSTRDSEEVIEYSLIADTWSDGQEGGSFWTGNYYVDVQIPLTRVVSGVTQTAVIYARLTYGVASIDSFTSFNPY